MFKLWQQNNWNTCFNCTSSSLLCILQRVYELFLTSLRSSCWVASRRIVKMLPSENKKHNTPLCAYPASETSTLLRCMQTEPDNELLMSVKETQHNPLLSKSNKMLDGYTTSDTLNTARAHYLLENPWLVSVSTIVGNNIIPFASSESGCCLLCTYTGCVLSSY